MRLQRRESIHYKIISPYIFLTVCILLSRLVPALHDLFRSYAVLDLKSYSYKLELLYSPGFWLGMTCLFTIIFFRIPSNIIKQSFSQTIKQWIPFAITTTMFIAISELMGASGMHSLLAKQLVKHLEPFSFCCSVYWRYWWIFNR